MSGGGSEIGELAERGDADAQFALGRQFEAAEKPVLARSWFARAARQGNVAALRSLAISLLTRMPIVERDGVNMIRAAAHKGDGEAAHVCGMLAAQDHQLEGRWAVARECLVRAAELGWDPARAELDFLAPFERDNGFDVLTAAAPVRAISESPRIGAIEGFLPERFCDWLIERAKPRLGRALVYDAMKGGGRVEEARSNSSVAFDLAQSDLILMLVRARIAATAGLASRSLEIASILHYAPGQQFSPHFDFLDAQAPGDAEDMAVGGQRVATFLVYLNDDYEGGETGFPRMGFSHKGRKGDALLFWNVDASGSPDQRTLHAGLPPTAGEKWLLSQWLREPPALPHRPAG